MGGNAMVAEVVIFDRVLASDELQRIGAYLENRYGLDTAYDDPRLPDVATLPPTDVSETAATLTGELESTRVVVSGGEAVAATQDREGSSTQ